MGEARTRQSRPRLERRTVPPNRGPPAVMQPILDLLTLRQPREPRRILRPERVFPRPQRHLRRVAHAPVRAREAAADQQDVARSDVAALRGGADVDALGVADGAEEREGDFEARGGGVVWDEGGVALEVGVDVEEEGAAGDAACGCPVVD